MELNLTEDRLFKRYKGVEKALVLAKFKHPVWSKDLTKQALVMLEEAGEVAQAVNDYQEGKGDISKIINELEQTAAMCIRMIENIKGVEK